ncbi:MAG TPA: DUF1801 domain-containing protein [Flavobacteriales bacterium]|nr:DUF1801 domain-containing protein [Flavobacteriales bacterium]
MKNPENVDAYIAAFPSATQKLLKQVRSTIKKAAPGALELISYGMPGYKLNGKALVYFAGYAGHIGFYATPTGHEEFKKELSAYNQGKGSVQFPIDEPMPLKLIEKIVRFRVGENNTTHTDGNSKKPGGTVRKKGGKNKPERSIK